MTSLIKRRTALGAFLGTAIAWPFALAAQQNRQKPLVGWLSSRSESESSAVLAAFRQGFAEAGFVENQNVEVIYRWAEGRYDLLPKLASELVDRKVDVIFAAGGPLPEPENDQDVAGGLGEADDVTADRLRPIGGNRLLQQAENRKRFPRLGHQLRTRYFAFERHGAGQQRELFVLR